MKALYALIALTLLAGCSSLTLSIKPVEGLYSDLPKPKVAEMTPADKVKASKQKTSASGKKFSSSSKTDISQGTNTSSANSAINPTTPLGSGKISSLKILKVGWRGGAVLALEKKLAELRYDMGAVDGFYDGQTWQGVMAFQKYTGLKRTGTYTLETREALPHAVLPEGLHPELGLPRIEINLIRQVMLFFDEQGLNRVIAVSTGSNRKYCETSKKSGKRICGVALTLGGKFRIQYRIPGWRESDLGKLYNPLYFYGGFAIHGSPHVPAHNVSHRCVRISIATSIWFYDAVKNGTPVVVYD